MVAQHTLATKATETMSHLGPQIWSMTLRPVKQKVNAAAVSKTAGGCSELIKQVSFCAVWSSYWSDWKPGMSLYSLWPVGVRRSTLAAFQGYYGIFASSNYLPDSWTTPFCFTQTKESTFCFCVLSLSQQSICSNRVHLAEDFLFLTQHSVRWMIFLSTK